MPKKNYGEPIPCLLELSPNAKQSKCRMGECRNCGWNNAVEMQRKLQIRQRGMTKDENGIRRLIVRKEKVNGQESICGRNEQGSDREVRDSAENPGPDGSVKAGQDADL